MSVTKKNRINIGAIIGKLEAPHAYELSKGMSHACRDNNANLLLFPGMHSRSFYDKSMLVHKAEYDYQFNTVYDYVIKEDIDVLLVSLGTVGDFLESELCEDFLLRFSTIPCIILEDNAQDKPSVTLNNKSGLYDCIKHLIEIHGYKKIAFVSGSLNNFDAVERLEVYREIMKEYHLPVKEDMIGYGDFTEYTEEIVASILDANPDTEAICFANDIMAIGGYRELKKRGLEIGKDIAVTGFDDYMLAMSMQPALTTVQVRPYNMGYQAVVSGIMYANGSIPKSIVIGSKLVVRESCGCYSNLELRKIDKVEQGFNQNMVFQYANYIVEGIINNPNNQFIYNQLMEIVKPFVKQVLSLIEINSDVDFRQEEITEPIRNLLNSEYIEYIEFDKYHILVGHFTQNILPQIKQKEKQIILIQIMTSVYGYITTYLQGNYQHNFTKYKKEAWYASYITRDTIIYAANEQEAMYQIMDKMKALCFKSAYIYLFKDPIPNYENSIWICPDEMYLAAYCEEKEIFSYQPEKRPKMKLRDGIIKVTSKDRRYQLTHFNLFANETQYGLLMCETDLKDTSFAYTISLQIGSALKFLHVMREQWKMQQKLEASIETISKKNELLNYLSISDELTGLLNRRGLFEQIIDKIVTNPGAFAAVVFVDMDNLKQVNDTFGHHEGDFALKNISSILKKCFRTQDALGRIGGDEFIAFVIVEDKDLIRHIREDLDRTSEELNNTCNKPYYIEMSIGIKEVVCDSNLDLKDILKEADKVLYADKKNKRKSCIKTDFS